MWAKVARWDHCRTSFRSSIRAMICNSLSSSIWTPKIGTWIKTTLATQVSREWYKVVWCSTMSPPFRSKTFRMRWDQCSHSNSNQWRISLSSRCTSNIQTVIEILITRITSDKLYSLKTKSWIQVINFMVDNKYRVFIPMINKWWAWLRAYHRSMIQSITCKMLDHLSISRWGICKLLSKFNRRWTNWCLWSTK